MRRSLTLLPLLATAALVAPAGAGAAPREVPDALFATGVPAGQVEHGITELQTSGVPAGREIHLRTEYWADADGFRSRTTDVATGAVVNESLSGPEGSAIYTANGPDLRRSSGRRLSPPYAGWTAAYNRGLLDRGVLVQTGERTVAGLPGVVFAVRPERRTTDPNAGDGAWVTDDPSGETELVFERDTFAPLMRITRADNGPHGRFEQREELLLRERVPAGSATARPLSRRSTARLARTWKQKVRAAARRGGRAPR
jgi:hypothetical protein